MADHGLESLAAKINYLFTAVHPRRSDGQRGPGREYSNEFVASEMARVSGVTISQSYLWQLRKGRKDNPTLRHLQALADFFGVPVAYFFDNEMAGQVSAQLGALAEEQARREVNESSASHSSNEVALMAMRASELSPRRRQQVMDLLDVVYQLEQAERRAQDVATEQDGTFRRT